MTEEFEYKGFVLKLGLVQNSYGKTEQGGYCEELNYKTFSKSSKEKDIANFKNYIDHYPIGQHKAKEKMKEVNHHGYKLILNKIQRLDGGTHYVGRCDSAQFVESCEDKSVLIDYFEAFIDKKIDSNLKEREVTCEEDVWYNIEVRNRRHLRDLKKLKELKK